MRTNTPKFSTPRAIFALIVREMSTTYGRSPGGYFWAVAEPIAGIALLTFFFSLMLRAPALGSNFAYFYATGMVPFTFYVDVNAKVSLSLKFSRQLLFYPRVTFTDALIARFLLSFFTQILIFFLVFLIIIQAYDIKPTLDFKSIFIGLGMAAILGLGIGTMNCFLILRIPVWQRIWAIFTRPLFLVSSIFYLFETVPEPFKSFLWYNPLVHIVGMMRRGFFATYDAAYVSVSFVCILSLVLMGFGLLLLGTYQRDLLHK